MVAATLGAVSVLRYGLHNHLSYLDVLNFIGRHGESFCGNNFVNSGRNRWLANRGNLVWAGDQLAPTTRPSMPRWPLPTQCSSCFPWRSGLIWPTRPGCCPNSASARYASSWRPQSHGSHHGVLAGMFIVAAGTAMASPPGRVRRMSAAILAVAWLLCASKLGTLVNRLSDTVLNPLQATTSPAP